MSKINSLGLLIGQGKCNARCEHCAGAIHRKYAPICDGEVPSKSIQSALLYCYERGARSVTISSSGEPTLSPKAVTLTLDLIRNTPNTCYDRVNLYTNGFRIATDEKFAQTYLPLWKEMGLDNIHLTVHAYDAITNAKRFGVRSWPHIRYTVHAIKQYNLPIRANLVLSRSGINTLEQLKLTFFKLHMAGIQSIRAWPVRDPVTDNFDPFLAPKENELDLISAWAANNPEVTVLREDNQEVYKHNNKLTLFPDGALTSSWTHKES